MDIATPVLCIKGISKSTNHAAEDAHQVESIQASVQEADRKERCKKHLSSSHHLVHRGGHRQQPNVHQHSGYKVKEGRNGQHENVLGAVSTDHCCFLCVTVLQRALCVTEALVRLNM